MNTAVARLFDPTKPPGSLRDVAGAYDELFAEVDREWRKQRTNSPAPVSLPDPDREALRQVLYG